MAPTEPPMMMDDRLDGDDIYWLEARPQEQGRYAVVRAAGPGGDDTDLTPKPFNARTRVHEYGGGSWIVADGEVFFSNFPDGILYRRDAATAKPQPQPQPQPQP